MTALHSSLAPFLTATVTSCGQEEGLLSDLAEALPIRQAVLPGRMCGMCAACVLHVCCTCAASCDLVQEVTAVSQGRTHANIHNDLCLP